jgi:hypothetical protein
LLQTLASLPLCMGRTTCGSRVCRVHRPGKAIRASWPVAFRQQRIADLIAIKTHIASADGADFQCKRQPGGQCAEPQGRDCGG